MVRENMTTLVVSGTADSGKEVARKVATAGGSVGFTYNNSKDEAEELLDELSEKHESWNCDITDPDDAESVINDAFETLGEIDAIVYTVGVISKAAIDDTSPEDWQNHLDANVTGAYNLIHAAAPHLKDQGHGSIVALSASDGIIRGDEFSAYDASKRGLEALVQETARELGPHGIRANIVAPGFIRDPDALSEDQRQYLLDQQPLKQLTTPADIAETCLYLCSDNAAKITGAVLPVDSGLAL